MHAAVGELLVTFLTYTGLRRNTKMWAQLSEDLCELPLKVSPRQGNTQQWHKYPALPRFCKTVNNKNIMWEKFRPKTFHYALIWHKEHICLVFTKKDTCHQLTEILKVTVSTSVSLYH